jgi:hypothetical protein
MLFERLFRLGHQRPDFFGAFPAITPLPGELGDRLKLALPSAGLFRCKGPDENAAMRAYNLLSPPRRHAFRPFDHPLVLAAHEAMVERRDWVHPGLDFLSRQPGLHAAPLLFLQEPAPVPFMKVLLVLERGHVSLDFRPGVFIEKRPRGLPEFDFLAGRSLEGEAVLRFFRDAAAKHAPSVRVIEGERGLFPFSLDINI